MSAADVIKSWSDQLGNGGDAMYGVVTAIQPGNPDLQSGNVAAYTAIALRRDTNGDLEDPEVILLFSDREGVVPGASINQPFDVRQAQNAMVELTLSGKFNIINPWGTDEIDLTDAGNNVLTGWGPSIGNKGVPSLWSITTDRQVHP